MVRYKMNTQPSLLATLGFENSIPIDQILIRPLEGHPVPSHTEVIDLIQDRRTGVHTIITNWKNEWRLALEQHSGIKDGIGELMPVFDKETTRFKINLTSFERSHLLGLSPLLSEFFPTTQVWDEEQKKILTFFLPYGSQIRGDVVLMEKCMQEALSTRVQLHLKEPEILFLESSMVGCAVLDSGASTGGWRQGASPCLSIHIGPIEIEQLINYVPGARWRKFLEEGLIPFMVPDYWDWNVHIQVEEQWKQMRIAEDCRPVCTGINTYLS